MYVAIEGIDTTGKSTQIEALRNFYKNAIITKEPSGGAFGSEIRNLALNWEISNITQAFLFLADRANHFQTIIKPNENKLIISDRSLISGIAYAKDLDLDLLVKINLFIAKKPDLAIVLKTDEKILAARLESKKSDNIEKNGIKYLLEIQERILAIARLLEIETLILPCDLSQNEISKKIIEKINL